MNGGNGYAPMSYGTPPGYVPAHFQPQGYGVPAPSQPYGHAPAQPPFASPYGAPPGPYGHVPYPSMPPMGMPVVPQKNPGLAVALELLGGFFLQTFGAGHLYAGNVGVGLGLMFGYWILTAINFVLCFAFIGFITWPLTWLAFMVISAITANNATKRANARF